MAKKGSGLQLSAPKQITWIIAVVLGVLGLLGGFKVLAFLAPYGFWLLAAGWLLLVLATLLEGL